MGLSLLCLDLVWCDDASIDKVMVLLKCLDCEIVTRSREKSVNFTGLFRCDFEWGIEMDWLKRQKAVMDCDYKMIRLDLVRRLRFDLQESRGGISIPWMA